MTDIIKAMHNIRQWAEVSTENNIWLELDHRPKSTSIGSREWHAIMPVLLKYD